MIPDLHPIFVASLISGGDGDVSAVAAWLAVAVAVVVAGAGEDAILEGAVPAVAVVEQETRLNKASELDILCLPVLDPSETTPTNPVCSMRSRCFQIWDHHAGYNGVGADSGTLAGPLPWLAAPCENVVDEEGQRKEVAVSG